MGFFSHENGFLIWQEDQQKVWLQPWGENGLRCQANLTGAPLRLPQALLEDQRPASGDVSIEIGDSEAAHVLEWLIPEPLVMNAVN